MLPENIIQLQMPQPQKHFEPPSIEEVLLQCAKIGLPAREGEKMYYFYDSKFWMVGKNKMRQWKSSLALWKLNYMERGGTMTKTVQQAKIPTRDEVYSLAREKDCKDDTAIRFYDFWASRNFQEQGRSVDWKLKLGEALAKRRV